MFLYFLFLIPLASSQNCLLFDKDSNYPLCLFCKAGFYNNKADAPDHFSKENCVAQIQEPSPVKRNVFIASSDVSDFQFQLLRGANFIVYKNIPEAFFNEDFISLSRNSTDKKIIFKLLSGNHFIFSKDMKYNSVGRFIRNKVEIEISVLYCDEAQTEMKFLCYSSYSMANIYLKTKNFFIFISFKLSLMNIILDGIDLFLEENKDPCANSPEICCLSLTAKCEQELKPSIYTENDNLLGMFNMEPLIENEYSVVPELTLANVTFKNLAFSKTANSQTFNTTSSITTLIMIFGFEGIVFINNNTFKNVYFPGGILQKISGIRSIYQSIFSDQTKLKLESYTTLVSIENCIFYEYNYLKRTAFFTAGSLLVQSSALFSFFEFKGTFTFKFNSLINSFLPNDGFALSINKKNMGTAGIILIMENNFSGNSFFYLLRITDTYYRQGLSASFLDNKVSVNSFTSFLELNNLKNFTLKGEFLPPFQLPASSFIIASFSVLVLSNCSFTGFLNFVNYPLIRLTSIYQVPYDTVFTIAKRTKGVFFANETTIFRNLVVKNCSLLLFSNMNLNYVLSIENSSFEKLFLEVYGNRPFIELVSEGLFSIKNLTFSNITAKTYLLCLLYYLNATIDGLYLNDINITDGHVLRFYSNTACNPAEHQLNLSSIFVNRIFFNLTSENFGKFLVSIFYSHSTESGKCSAARINTILLSNIFYNLPHLRHQALIFDSSYFKINNFKSYNFSNGIVISFRSQVAAAEMYMESVFISNQMEFPMIRLFDCGQAYYSYFQLSNSDFSVYKLISNKAAGLNLAQKVSIRNATFSVFLESGTVVFAQSTKLSYIFVENVAIQTYPGSLASLLTIITETQETGFPWNDTQKIDDKMIQSFVNFGVRNSSFQNSYESAVVLLVQTQLMFIDCAFRNNYGKEGAVIKLAQNSLAVFFRTKVRDASAETMGGSFSVENSVLIIIEGFIINSNSFIRGGCINAVESDIRLVKVSFFNTSSETGGVLFGDTCKIIISQSNLSYAVARKYGAHLVSKQGNLVISGSVFSKGSSAYFGGALYLEATTFDINFTDFINCYTKLGTLYAINGIVGKVSTLANVKFLENSADDEAASLYCSDISISAFSLELIANNAKTGFLFIIFGSFLKPVLRIDILRITLNKAREGIFSQNEASILLSNAILEKNTLLAGGSLFVFTKSTLLINFSLLSHIPIYDAEKTQNTFAFGRMSNFNINGSFVTLNKKSGFLTCYSCPDILAYKSFFLGGFSNQGSVFKLVDSKLYGVLIYLRENVATEGGAIHSDNSSIFVKDACFTRNIARISGSDLWSHSVNPDYALELNIISCLFHETIGTSIEAVGLTLNFKEISVYGKKQALRSQAILSSRCPLILIDKSEFQFFESASAIQIENDQSFISNIKISFSFFNNSKVPDGSGGFLNISGNTDLSVESTNFSYGFAKQGGAIYIECPTSNCPVTLSHCYLTNLKALDSGGAISSQSLNIFQRSLFFMNNQAEIGENINFFPTKFAFFLPKDEGQFSKDQIINEFNNKDGLSAILLENNTLSPIPGYPFSLGFLILDDAGNIQSDENDAFAMITIVGSGNQSKESDLTEEKHYFTNSLAKVINGVGLFEGITLIGNTDRKIQAVVSYSRNRYKVNHSFDILAQRCRRGDSFQDLRCQRCSEHFYSLENYPEVKKSPCEKCPENAYCPGGDIIIPRANFWRRNANSPLIFGCKMKEGCQLQALSLFKGVSPYEFSCAEGYEGNLCQECVRGYGVVNDLCVKCNSMKIIFVLILLSGFIIYLILLHIEENRFLDQTANDDSVPIMKILVNHISMFIILTSMKVNWNEYFKKFLFITSVYVSTSPSTIFSFDCFFEWEKEEKALYTIIIAGFSPLFLTVLAFVKNVFLNIIRFLFKRFKNRQNELRYFFKLHISLKWWRLEFFMHLTILFLNIYPPLLLNMFKVFGCKSLDMTSDKYLTQLPWVLCESEYHNKIQFLSLLFIAIWGVAFPLVLVYFIKTELRSQSKKNNKVKFDINQTEARQIPKRDSILNFKLYKDQTLARNKIIVINYILQGYKRKYYWWEISVFSRKVLFFCIASFSEEMDVASIGGLSIYLLSFYLLNTLFLQPYLNSSLNMFEAFSLLVSIASISLGLITSFGEEVSEMLKTISFISLTLINLLFFLTWFILYFKVISRCLVLRIRKSIKMRKESMAAFNKTQLGGAKSRKKISKMTNNWADN